MEASNLPVVAKKFWDVVRTALLILRKGIISKTKLMLDINLVLKRGKVAGKNAIDNLMFHHTRHLSSRAASGAGEYEFSCSNSPAFAFHLPRLAGKSKHRRHAPPQSYDDYITASAVVKALEILHSETASPTLPGFGRTPVVRQLRVTDSPFPVSDGDENRHVDEAAEAFISRFYSSLKKQSVD